MFHYQNLLTNELEYQTQIESRIKAAVDDLGEKAFSYDLSRNLLTWLTFKVIIEDRESHLQTFHFNSDIKCVFLSLAHSPSFILCFNFDKVTILHLSSKVFSSFGGELTGELRERDSMCQISHTTRFDESSSRLTISYDFNQYVNDENCSQIVDPISISPFLYPNKMGKIPIPNSNWDLSFDIRTFFISMAINMQVYTDFTCGGELSYCIELEHTEYVFGADQPPIYQYIDPQHPGMDSTYCLARGVNGSSFDLVCALSIGDQIKGIPLFNHVGKYDDMTDQYRYCDW